LGLYGIGPIITATLSHDTPNQVKLHVPVLFTGQQPFITLFHSDFPQALEDEYGGFLNPRIV